MVIGNCVVESEALTLLVLFSLLASLLPQAVIVNAIAPLATAAVRVLKIFFTSVLCCVRRVSVGASESSSSLYFGKSNIRLG